MKINFAPLQRYNLAKAYQEHGKRYAMLVAAEALLPISCLALALLTLWGNLIDLQTTDVAYQIGLFIAKAMFVLVMFVGLESLYWKVKLSGPRKSKLPNS